MQRERKEHLEELKGYRNPTEEEKKKIYHYMQTDLQARRKQMKFFERILGGFAVIMTVRILIKVFEGISNYAEFTLSFIIVIVFWVVFVALHKSLLTNRILEVHVREGNYLVLDCMPYKHRYDQDSSRTEGSVQIQTQNGIPCRGNFVVDIETALLCEKGKELPLLLMYENETKESKVFSEKMLNRR